MEICNNLFFYCVLRGTFLFPITLLIYCADRYRKKCLSVKRLIFFSQKLHHIDHKDAGIYLHTLRIIAWRNADLGWIQMWWCGTYHVVRWCSHLMSRVTSRIKNTQAYTSHTCILKLKYITKKSFNNGCTVSVSHFIMCNIITILSNIV